MAPAGSVELLDSRTLHRDRYGAEEDRGPFVYAADAAADAVPIGPARYPPVLSEKMGTVGGGGLADRRSPAPRPFKRPGGA